MADRKNGMPRDSDATRSLIASALRRAALVPVADSAKLVAAVPRLQSEAERRRRLAAAPAARLVSAGASWLPRFALATAALVFAALLAGRRGRTTEAPAAPNQTASLDSWVVTGTASATPQDPVLAGLIGTEEGS